MIYYNGKKIAYIGNVKPSGELVITSNGIYNVASKSSVIVNVNTDGAGTPITVATAAEMDRILESSSAADSGKVFLYLGDSTENYEQNAYYKLEV